MTTKLNNVLPCCYYPTEVVFLDDNKTYLEMLKTFTEGTKLPIVLKTFLDYKDAITHINQPEKLSYNKNLIERLVKHVDTFKFNCYSLSVDLYDLHKEIYNAKRFNQISVVIADYDLKNYKTGLDFCVEIEDKSIQKILFTGQTDNDCVISAFNDGVIQKFVHKKDVNSFEKIQKMLFDAQQKYFCELTTSIVEAIGNRVNYPLAICNVTFQKFFLELLKQHKIVEFYILDPVGSYLLVDANAKSYILFVQNDDQQRANLLEIGDDLDCNLPKSTCDKIKSGESIICLPNFICNNAKPTEPLANYIYEATVLNDDKNETKFYCALTEDTWLLNKNTVTSFAKFNGTR